MKFKCDNGCSDAATFYDKVSMHRITLTAVFLVALSVITVAIITDTDDSSAEVVSGNCGTNLSWSLDTSTGILSITGTGTVMRDFPQGGGEWKPYCNSITAVELPINLSNIGNSAFYGCENLTSIVIPDNVTSIGAWAFRESGLTSISLSDNVTKIDKDAFEMCDLTSVEIPDNVTFLGEYAFAQCVSLERAVIGNGLTTIGTNVFIYCTLLSDVTLNYGLTSVGQNMFFGCENLESVLIPNSVTKIGNAAFNGTGLRTIILPDSVTTIEDSVFANCKKLNVAFLPNGLTTLSNGIFNGCNNLLSVNIPNTLTSIGGGAFNGCSSLTGELIIPSGVTSIGDSAFCNTGFTGELIIPDNVASIGFRAFYGCSDFTGELTIPNSVSFTSNSAFYGCTGITSVKVTLAPGKISSAYVLNGNLGDNWRLPQSNVSVNRITIDTDQSIDLSNINAGYEIGKKTLVLTDRSVNTYGGILKNAAGDPISGADRAYRAYINDTSSSFMDVQMVVTLDANGGSVNPTSVSACFGTAYGNLPTPMIVGSMFNGWYLNGTKITSTSLVLTPGNHTLEALWSYSTNASNVKVTFNANGGIVNPTTKMVSYGQKYGSLPMPENEGYAFDGWYLNGNEITGYSNVDTRNDHTLTARWSDSSDDINGSDDDSSRSYDPLIVVFAASALMFMMLLILAYIRRRKDEE